MKSLRSSLSISTLTLATMCVAANSTLAQTGDDYSARLPAVYAGQTGGLKLAVTNQIAPPTTVQLNTPPTPPPSPQPPINDPPREVYDGLPRATSSEQADAGRRPGDARAFSPRTTGRNHVAGDSKQDQAKLQDQVDDDDDDDDDDDNEAGHEDHDLDELQENFAAMDRLLASATVKRIMGLMIENVELKAELRVQLAEAKVQQQLLELKFDRELERTKLAREQAQVNRGESATRQPSGDSHRDGVERLQKALASRAQESQNQRAASEQHQLDSLKLDQLQQVAERLTDQLRQAERGRTEAERRAALLEQRLDELQQRFERAQKVAAEQEPRREAPLQQKRAQPNKLKKKKSSSRDEL